MRKLILSLLLCFVLVAFFTVSCAATGKNEASLRINDAENALDDAFNAVQKTERLNANVSRLMNDLNVAGGLLDEAEIAYKNGDLYIALRKADQSSVAANRVLNEATWLYDSASAGAQEIFWLTIIFSIEGAVLFIVVLLIVWAEFSSFYIKRLLKMKVEVPSDVDA